MSGQIQTGVTNVLSNTVLPFDIRKPKLLIGSAQLILMEVLVAKVIRKILQMPNRGFGELALIHAVSLPLLGGFSGFFDPNSNIQTSSAKDSFRDGAKGIPGVFAAQYITNVGAKGLHIPSVSFKEVLVTAASRF